MKQIKIMSWNVRGLGSDDKCNGVRNLIRVARCDVVCVQESKLNEFNLAYFSSFLPSYLEKHCVYINAIHSSGGCLISWRKNYTHVNSWSTRHTYSVTLQRGGTGEVFTND
jgi:exonuclease III